MGTIHAMDAATSIALTGIKACAERLAASAHHAAYASPAERAIRRTKEQLDTVEFVSHIDALKMASTNANSMLNIFA